MSTKTVEQATVNERPLPPGWRWVKLGEVCEFIYGEGLPSHLRQSGNIPVYGSNGIVGYHDKSITNGSTIVIGRKGSIGEVHFCAGPCWPIDTTYYIEKTKLPINLEWLAFWLKALRLTELNKAAAVPGLNRKDAYELEISLPPLAEQQRIAAILKEQMAAVERARRAAEEQLEAAKALPAAYLRQVFPRQCEPLPAGWRWVKLGAVCEFRRGPFGSSLRKEIFVAKGYAVYEQGNAIYSDFSHFRYFVDEQKYEAMRSFHVHPGDIIMSCSGTMGKAAVVPEYAQPGIINQALLKITPLEITASFLKVWMDSPGFQEQLINLAFGAAIKNVASVDMLKSVSIPLPPLAEQQRIAAFLKEKMDAAERLRKVLEEQLETINKLPAAILRKAFNGEL